MTTTSLCSNNNKVLYRTRENITTIIMMMIEEHRKPRMAVVFRSQTRFLDFKCMFSDLKKILSYNPIQGRETTNVRKDYFIQFHCNLRPLNEDSEKFYYIFNYLILCLFLPQRSTESETKESQERNDTAENGMF